MSNDLRLSTGLVSGIDSAALVDALTARQKEPINIAERKTFELRVTKEEYQSVFSSLSALEDASLQLSLSSTFTRKTASSSDESVLTATATTAATTGSYALNVTQLAQTHSVSSDAQTSATASVVPASRTVKINGVSMTFSAGSSLNTMRDGINGIQSQTNVKAEVINNRLVLSSTESGAENEMTLEDTSGNLFQALGILRGNSTSNVTAASAKGTVFQSVTVGDWRFAPGTFTVNGQAIQTAGGETFGEVATKIQNLNIPGITVSNTATNLSITSANGPLELEDVEGINATMLQGVAYKESSALGALNLAGKTLFINGNAVDFGMETTVQEAADRINSEKIPGIRATRAPGTNRLRIFYAEDTPVVLNGSALPDFGTMTDRLPIVNASNNAFYNTDAATMKINNFDVTFAAQSTLTQIRDTLNLNTGDTGVSAVINNGQLELSTTGGLNISDVTGDLAEVLGINSNQFKNEIRAAQDAVFELNGISVNSASNNVDDVIPDVTISLKGLGSSTLDVKNDTDSSKTSILNFIEAYNQTVELLDSKIRAKKDYSIKGLTEDEQSEMEESEIEDREEELRKQVLAGDPLLQRLYNLLRSYSYTRVDGISTINSFSAMGISTGTIGSNPEQTRIGKLQIIDQSKFDAALADNLSDVTDFFTKKDEGLSNSQKGIGERLKIEIRKYTAFDGFLTAKAGRPGQVTSTSLIDRQIASLSLDILNKNRSLLKYQETLLLTFQNMESALQQLQGQSSALAQQSGGL